jgi:DNA-directed RNA polymerase subunit RPC12/RpoP
MVKCEKCGGRVRRVHRTFLERFSYMAIYECRDCEAEKFVARRYTYHFGPHCRCPHCGTYRVTRLKAPDKIDSVHTGFLNYLERLAGGRLHHCRYCRVQFYDRRMLASEDKAAEAAANGQEVASSRNGADSDA